MKIEVILTISKDLRIPLQVFLNIFMNSDAFRKRFGTSGGRINPRSQPYNPSLRITNIQKSSYMQQPNRALTGNSNLKS